MDPVLPEIAAIAPELIALRQRIHAHPELAFEETVTSDLVAECLTAWGYQVHRGLGGTGVVGVLRAGSAGRSIGLRADMDALPLAENTGLPYASVNPGKMHACGHDGHTAMLLCAARHLARTRAFDGTVNLIFQPAEEGFGGAKAMIDDGLFERFPCDAVFALHNMPGIAAGDMAFCVGPMTASSDSVTIRLRGEGGHGAFPHRACDPMPAAGAIMLALQTIVGRDVDPLDAAVISVGSVHAGEAFNIIPEQVEMRLSVRTLDANVRQRVEQRIRALVAGQAQSFGLQADIDYARGYPVLVNDPQVTAFATRVAHGLLGEARVDPQSRPVMGSEDFAYMLEQVPGCYAYIGNGLGSRGGCMVHNPAYDFNDDILALGATFWVRLTETWLTSQ
ncbi:amidohydrolase [Pantoea sp. Tr-811]|uniref:M20 aminoacylase family protein n=1 Tax=Pantoea sp. Tr-811 TaxID=2608361 RepID=UPI00142106D4|nr:M20 aminoacylase family protein [Pantoea sp. Tr-811]NIF27609.1 amidohydrolase [Pantoea sp. Tr-811]